MFLTQRTLDMLLASERKNRTLLEEELVRQRAYLAASHAVEEKFWNSMLDAEARKTSFFSARCIELEAAVQRERLRADAAVDRLLAKEANVAPIGKADLEARAAADAIIGRRKSEFEKVISEVNMTGEDEGREDPESGTFVLDEQVA